MSDLRTQLQAVINGYVDQLRAALRLEIVAELQKALGGAAPAVASVAAAAKAPTGKKRGRPANNAAAASAPAASAPAARAAKKKPGAKRIRRSAQQIEQTATRILDHVRKNPGQGAEQIKKALGLSKEAWMLPIKNLVDGKKLVTKGQKRSTTYTAR